MSVIKVGFIGYGGSARFFHLPYVLPNTSLKIYAFLQRTPAPAEPASVPPGTHCTVDFPDAKHYRSSEEFFADEEIELVIVCTHTDTHAEFAERALSAGKNVVVEKPFTRSSEEADALIEVAKETGKILTVFQNRRWDGDFLTLQNLLSKGALGTITQAEIHYDFENPSWLQYLSAKNYTPGSGMMFSLVTPGTHTIDQALVLFGQPKSVTGFLRVLRGIESEIEDTFTIILQYDSQLLVTIKTTTITPMQEQLKYFIRGTQGSFIKHGTDAQEAQAIAGLSTTDPKFGVDDERLHGLLTTYREFDSKYQNYDAERKKYIGRIPTSSGRIRGYYENVVGAIRGTAELQVKPEQARDGIRIIELARQSNEIGATIPWS